VVAPWDRLDVGHLPAELRLDPADELRSEVVVQYAERVRPELLERLVESRACLLRGEQPVDPHLRVDTVVDLLAIDLRRDACDLGYLVTQVTDACATYTQERHDFSIRAIKGYCRQRTTDQLVAEIAGLG